MEEEDHCTKTVKVTNENFETELPIIQQTIAESAFVAFDMEFSGLDSKKTYKSVGVDSVI